MLNFRKIYFLHKQINHLLLTLSRLRQIAERSEYFRAELRSLNHQTFFLPNDQAFASFGSSLSFLFEQSNLNEANDVRFTF